MKLKLSALLLGSVLTGCASKPEYPSYLLQAESVLKSCGSYAVMPNTGSEMFVRTYETAIHKGISIVGSSSVDKQCYTRASDPDKADYTFVIGQLFSSSDHTSVDSVPVYGTKSDGSVTCNTYGNFTQCSEGSTFGVTGYRSETNNYTKYVTAVEINVYSHAEKQYVSRVRSGTIHYQGYRMNLHAYNLLSMAILSIRGNLDQDTYSMTKYSSYASTFMKGDFERKTFYDAYYKKD